jgi:hypothetical protein
MERKHFLLPFRLMSFYAPSEHIPLWENNKKGHHKGGGPFKTKALSWQGN